MVEVGDDTFTFCLPAKVDAIISPVESAEGHVIGAVKSSELSLFFVPILARTTVIRVASGQGFSIFTQQLKAS